jgi:hypothetical protein
LKGYKNCENCHKRNSARNLKCDCGHVFLATQRVVDYTKPSRGKKQCKCGAYIGVRSEYCPVCKERYEEKAEAKRIVEQPKRYKGGRIIYCPAGACPINLKSFDREEVMEWCDCIYSYFNDTYTADAMIYWLRKFFKINSYEYNTSKRWVEEWADLSPDTQKILLNQKTPDVIYAGKNSPSQVRSIHKLK